MESLRKSLGRVLTTFNRFASKNARKLFLPCLIIAILLFAALVLNFKDLFVVALVNNRPISRVTLDRELEKQAGSSILENMIIKTLINQNAKKKGISITLAEVSQQIAEIEKQFAGQDQNLDTLLATRGQTRKDLTEQIEIQLMVEKILADEAEVTDEEIAKYFEENKSSFPKGTVLEDKKEEIKEMLYQQKMSDAFQTWTDKMKEEAKIIYFLKL